MRGAHKTAARGPQVGGRHDSAVRGSVWQLVRYISFGVCTTLVNIVAYYLFAHCLGLSTSSSTIVSWVISVAFAYVTNKLWVFDSKSWQLRPLLREALSFYVCRLLTGALDLGIMLLTVNLLHWNDMLMKVLSNILVIILNFVASRALVFRRRAGGQDA